MQPTLLARTDSHAHYKLSENHPLRLTRSAGLRVECLAGKTWITAYNLAADIALQPGEVFVVPNNGLVLIEAIGSSRVRIEQPQSLARTLVNGVLTGVRKWVWRVARRTSSATR